MDLPDGIIHCLLGELYWASVTSFFEDWEAGSILGLERRPFCHCEQDQDFWAAREGERPNALKQCGAWFLIDNVPPTVAGQRTRSPCAGDWGIEVTNGQEIRGSELICSHRPSRRRTDRKRCCMETNSAKWRPDARDATGAQGGEGLSQQCKIRRKEIAPLLRLSRLVLGFPPPLPFFSLNLVPRWLSFLSACFRVL